jgi:phage tail sheath protein FI
MPTNYFVPGVYIEEVPPGSKPIQGVGTSMPAFVGFTKTRPVDANGDAITRPHFVASWTQFQNDFGDEAGCFVPGFYLPLAVYGYFMNGGRACYIQSLVTAKDIERSASSGGTRAALPSSGGTNALELRSRTDGAVSQGITVEVGDATPGEGVGEDQFKVTIRVPGQPEQVIDNLTMGKGKGARNAVEVLTREARALLVKELDSAGTLVERRPKNGTYTLAAAPSTTLASAKTFQGSASARTGIGALEEIPDITMLICPDLMSGYVQGKLTLEDVAAVQSAMLTHCASMKDRFAILDAPPGMSPQEINEWRMNSANYPKTDAKYGALYYPWVYVANPEAKNGADKMILVPPSGHLAGVYARVDTERGVHKAPANESIRGATKLERGLIDSEQALLNPNGINCIRAFPGRGILVWGARTLAPKDELDWMYINVRRLFNYIEESIYEATQWVVFEPNDMDLWERVKRTINDFLTRVWRDGALFGATPEEAFYVKCDVDLNPPAQRDLGILVVEIGLAPVKPAEFVIFRFKQMSGGGGVSE